MGSVLPSHITPGYTPPGCTTCTQAGRSQTSRLAARAGVTAKYPWGSETGILSEAGSLVPLGVNNAG